MDSSDGEEISFCSDDGRAFVKPYADIEEYELTMLKRSKFGVGDKVNLIGYNQSGGEILEGPYLIETVPSPKHYTLCTEEGRRVQSGRVVKQEQLKEAAQ
ncbi:hypothetical protein N7528_004422 [Penicillium herquei]|nr:hypothetical protein N7528_004422 [Penicillium herquei]